MSKSSKYSIAIVAPGAMGAAISAWMAAKGVEVMTNLDGRSSASSRRASDSRMKHATYEELSTADAFLSVVPPDQALLVAQTLSKAAKTTGSRPLYVDLNAVSPRTAHVIAETIESAGIPFTDGGIIGPPPREGTSGPTLYLSGADQRAGLLLRELGFDARHIDSRIGAASALKMSYAGLTKGLTALGTAMLLAAAEAGVADALMAELGESQTQLLARLRTAIPDMLPKAYRWAPEMQEIADFIGENRPEAGAFEALAHFYRQLAQGRDRESLDAILRLAQANV